MDTMISEKMTFDRARALVREAFAYVLPERNAEAPSIPLTATVDVLGIQSVQALEMVGYVEDKLTVYFADDDVLKIVRLGDLVALIMKHAS
jgi:acyl carrier protein